MPFDVFHSAVRETLRRPVVVRDFAVNYEGMKAEIEARGIDMPYIDFLE